LDGASNTAAAAAEEEEEEALTWTLDHAKRQRVYVASVFVAGRKGTESR